MKLQQYLLAGWLLLTCLTGCKHDPDPITPVTPPGTELPGNSTNIGQPLGEVISQVVGPEGGTLTSADGQVELVLPAGALAKATTITVQAITNNAPNGLGVAYRFSPDGTQFAKPGTLTFRYDASRVANNDPAVFQVAFQGSDKHWYRQPGATTDTTTHQITVPMPHFSDWSAYELAKIEAMDIHGGPAKGEYLDFGASTNLEVLGALLEPLTQTGNEKSLEIASINWSVAGGAANGQVKGEGDKAVYTAPGTYPPQNPVTVVAEITFKNSPIKIFLLKRILIGRDYFKGTFNGVPFDWPNLIYNRLDLNSQLVGWSDDNPQSLNVLFSPRSPENPVGSYAYKANVPRNGNGTAFVEFAQSYDGLNGFLSFIYPCSSDKPLISPNQVTITQVDYVNGDEYIKGSLRATLHNLGGPCPTPIISKSIQAEFRIKRVL